MTIQEIEQKLNECQKALAELKESKKEGKWKPEKGEDYWFRHIGRGIVCYNYEGDITDKCVCEYTKIFPTKESCERYWHFMDTVKEKSYEFTDKEWEDYSIKKHIICYTPYQKKMFVDELYATKVLGEIYFKTKEDAQYIIDNFKDELMEYWI